MREREEELKVARRGIIPPLCLEEYYRVYGIFDLFIVKEGKLVKNTTADDVLLFLKHLLRTYSPGSLYKMYTAFCTCHYVEHNVDFRSNKVARAWIKSQVLDHKPRRAPEFEEDDVMRFLKDAPEPEFLLEKTRLVSQLFMCGRGGESGNLMWSNITMSKSEWTIHFDRSKSKKWAKTIIKGVFFLSILTRYRDFMWDNPVIAESDRVWFQVRDGHPHAQPIGKGSFYNYTKNIAR